MNQHAEIAIRMARAAFNKALAEADLAAIGPILSPNALLVTGTDSGTLAGRKAQLMAWKREFSAADRTLYVRTPDTILLSEIEPIAFEHGSWSGTSQSGQSVARGAYTAKWRQHGAAWVIEAELYLTLA
jgi:ketosteroid isomerase-like protein